LDSFALEYVLSYINSSFIPIIFPALTNFKAVRFHIRCWYDAKLFRDVRSEEWNGVFAVS